MAAPAKRPCVGLMCKYPGGLEDGVIRGVVDYARHHTNWQFVADGHRPFKPFEQIDLGEVDGVIGFFIERAWADAVVEAGVCAVDTSEHFADLPVPRVTTDDMEVGRMGAAHLLETGAAHFAFVTTQQYRFCQNRLAGFEEVMRGANRRFELWSIPEDRRETRADWIADRLENVATPIGIMGHSDYIVTDVVNGAIRHGLRIPEDVAVIGVEKDPWASTVAEVSLTSIELDTHRTGHEAAKLLEGLMDGQVPPPPRYIPPIGVVPAASTDITFNQDPVISRAMQFIRDHFAEPINVEDVLGEVGVSRPTLLKRMKRATGMATSEAIAHARIEEGKRLLMHSDLTIEQIAFRCGFRRQPRFNEVFKRVTDMTPGQYRHRRLHWNHPLT
jgi:LacI family transcriptional regulator